MDRLSKLFLMSIVAVLLISSTGAALGHPVAENTEPDRYFYWYQLLVQEGVMDCDLAPETIKEEEEGHVRIIEHEVKKGDTIKALAREYGVKESTIINNNNIENPNLIVLGQIIRFPSIDGLIYTVESGDTLHRLAEAYQITVSEILEVNDVETTELSIGTTLLLPNAKPKVAKTSSVSRSASTITGLRNLSWPVSGVVTSSYGWRKNPFNRSENQFHRGLDIGASSGTSINAATSGKVVHSGWVNGYGYTVILEHGNDYTLYAHASSLSVKKGQWVNAGQEIGKVGATGNATGPHLHFEVRLNGNSSSNTVNPMNYLAR